MNNSWNKDNYKSCFETDKSNIQIFDPNSYYEVLNSTDNCIILYPRNAKYVFEVTIVDPDFSYCHLTTQFEIEIWGEPMGIWLIIAVICITLGISITFIVSYHFYLNKQLKMEINKKNQKKETEPSNISKLIHND